MSGPDSSDMRLPLPLSPYAIYITLDCCVWHQSTGTFQTACRFKEPQRGHLIFTGHKRDNIPIFKVEENTLHYLSHLVSKHAVFLRESECLMTFPVPKKYHLRLCWTDKHQKKLCADKRTQNTVLLGVRSCICQRECCQQGQNLCTEESHYQALKRVPFFKHQCFCLNLQNIC